MFSSQKHPKLSKATSGESADCSRELLISNRIETKSIGAHFHISSVNCFTRIQTKSLCKASFGHCKSLENIIFSYVCLQKFTRLRSFTQLLSNVPGRQEGSLNLSMKLRLYVQTIRAFRATLTGLIFIFEDIYHFKRLLVYFLIPKKYV